MCSLSASNSHCTMFFLSVCTSHFGICPISLYLTVYTILRPLITSHSTFCPLSVSTSHCTVCPLSVSTSQCSLCPLSVSTSHCALFPTSVNTSKYTVSQISLCINQKIEIKHLEAREFPSLSTACQYLTMFSV